MFEQTFIQSQAKTRRPWTVALSLTLQCMAVAIVLLIPLLRPQKLRLPDPPKPHLISTWIVPPPLQPQKRHLVNSALAAPQTPRPFIYAPPSVHTTSARQIDVPSADLMPTEWSGLPAAAFGPSLTAGTALPPRVAPEPRVTQAAPKPPASGPLKVSEGVQGARLLFGPHPAYPRLAIAARSQGTVKLEAIIAADGSIRNLRVVSGPPLLADAALSAVRQWRYQPTLLNGVAVEVVTEIEVNFTLAK